MGGLSIAHWGILALVGVLLLGRGRFSGMMGDIGQGLSRFRREMSQDEPPS